MRFNDRVTFVTETDSYYDPSKGEYVEGTTEKETKPCHLSALGVERTNELFGQLDKKITVARLQHPYNKPFNYVLLNGQNTKYYMRRESNYKKGVFYLEGATA